MFTGALRSILVAGAVMASAVQASPEKDLASAVQRGQIAFILVMEPGAPGLDQAKALIREAMNRVENAALVELDRSSPANASLIAKYRLAGAPVPLILVAARNGALAGGIPAAEATPEKLLAVVPSPKKAEVIQLLQAGKAVFISVSRKTMPARAGATSACAAACAQMKDQGATVGIDLDDPREAEFLAQLRVDRAATEPVTLVVNPQGQIAGTYTGATDVASLVQAAARKAGGCAPGACGPGSASSCAPTKK
jgi:hypothetical protein